MQAAEETGFTIEIGGAYDVHDRPLQGDVGVYTRMPEKEHEPFWKRYHELRG